jgi:uncharacterized membrane protein HdeD (DUF308 family)
MLAILARNWWMMAVRGAAAMLFGIAAFAWPEITLTALVLLFAAYAMVDGVFSVIAAFKDRREHGRWWVLLLEGLVGIAVGILAGGWPRITALVLLYLIVGWAIATGVLEIVAAVLLRKEIEGEWLLALSGILSLFFGVVVGVRPRAGALTIVWLIAAYAIVFGVLLIILAFRLRGWYTSLQDRLGQSPTA